MDIPYDFMCEKQNIQSLLKGLGITVADQFETLEEKVLAYMDLVREFDKKELFIFWNLRCLIPQGRLQLMVDTAMQREHKILFIDSTEYPKLKQERRLIIDEDLCEIWYKIIKLEYLMVFNKKICYYVVEFTWQLQAVFSDVFFNLRFESNVNS